MWSHHNWAISACVILLKGTVFLRGPDTKSSISTERTRVRYSAEFHQAPNSPADTDPFCRFYLRRNLWQVKCYQNRQRVAFSFSEMMMQKQVSLKGEVYLKKQPDEWQEIFQGFWVVRDLLPSFSKCQKCNFFTSNPLADMFLNDRLMHVGTMRSKEPEVPEMVTERLACPFLPFMSKRTLLAACELKEMQSVTFYHASWLKGGG